MAARIFAVLAAVFLVVAIGLAALTSPGLTLGQGLLMLDRQVLDWLHAHLVAWLWDWALLPVLLRPLWLVPACIGVLCAGVAMSLNMNRPSPSRRRRS